MVFSKTAVTRNMPRCGSNSPINCVFCCVESIRFGAWRTHHKDNSRGGWGNYPTDLLQLSFTGHTGCSIAIKPTISYSACLW